MVNKQEEQVAHLH